MLRFRAELIAPDITLMRPVTIYGNNQQDLADWGRKILAACPSSKARVDVYEIREILVETVQTGVVSGKD